MLVSGSYGVALVCKQLDSVGDVAQHAHLPSIVIHGTHTFLRATFGATLHVSCERFPALCPCELCLLSLCAWAGNMTGRLGLAALSDFLGRQRTYALFGLGIPICLAVPTLTATVASDPSVLPLVVFYGGIVTMVGLRSLSVLARVGWWPSQQHVVPWAEYAPFDVSDSFYVLALYSLVVPASRGFPRYSCERTAPPSLMMSHAAAPHPPRRR